MSTVADPHEMLYPSRGGAAYLPGADAPAAAGGITPADLLRIVKQRKLMILITFLLLYVLVGATTAVVYFFFPSFPAQALVEVRPQTDDPYETKTTVSPETLRQQIETEARKIKQLGLLQEVLQQPEIKATNFYKWYANDLTKCMYDLEDMVGSTPIPESLLIRVTFACANAEEARIVLQMIVDRYVQRFGTASENRERSRVEGLKHTLTSVKEDIRAKQNEISTFRAQSDIPTLETERGTTTLLISEVNKRVSEIEAELADAQAQLISIQGLSSQQLPITAEMKLIIENDPILRFYRQQVEALDIEIKALAQILGTSHRQVITLLERRDGYSQKETSHRDELIDDLRRRYVETLQQNVARFRSVQAQLQEKLGQSEAKQRDLDRDIERYKSLGRDEESLRKLQEEIEDRVRGAEHALETQKERKNVRVEIVQKPEKANKPARPDFVLYLGGGAVLALLGAFGLAFLRELGDTTIRTPLDVIRHGQLAVLGAVPVLDYDEAEIENIESATRVAPHSLVAEAFRQIRTTLQYSGPAQSQRVILITSPRAEDGKTAIAINLAVTLSRGNQRVLLIDGNFRRPSIRQHFSTSRPEGLSNILIGEASLAGVVTKTDVANLDILTSGRMPPTPADLLGSPLMRELLKEATQKYDRVIVDGPPVLLISDALVLATEVDVVILVTRAVANSKGALRRAREQLERVGARVVGAVLNGVRPRAGGYFGQQYREFYEYGSEESVPYELPPAPPPPDEPVEKTE